MHNNRINNQSKHIDVVCKNTENIQKNGLIKLSYININKMIINSLIKPLQGEKHQNFLRLIELQDR